MLIIEMCDDGDLVPDSKAREFAENKMKQYQKLKTDMTVKVGTEMMLSGFVLPVIKHCFNKDDIKFYYEGIEYFYDDYLGLDELADPNKHVGYFADIGDEILCAGIRNLRNDREN